MKDIAKCIAKVGIRKLTPLQRKVFEIITKHERTAIVVSPTGTGKTEAAILPILYMIKKNNLKPISAIYITPLRALNRDIEKRLLKLSECFGLRVALRHGDTPYSRRRIISTNPPHLLITTPETFNYLLINDKISPYLRNLKYIVIDEFREILESKRGMLFLTSLYLFEKQHGKKLVKVALTATLKKEEYARQLLEGNIVPVESIVVRSGQSKKYVIKIEAPRCISQLCREINEIIPDKDLSARIESIIKKLLKFKGILIFTNTRSIAERLGFLVNKVIEELYNDSNIHVAVHHGSLSRSHRLEVEEKFKKGLLKAIIATSSMELGIDIGYVDYVIQYMSPRQVTRLVQRIGRSGHFLEGESRGSIVLQSNLYQILEASVLAQRAVRGEIEEEEQYSSPLDVLAYSIVLYALMNKNGVNINDLFTLISLHPLYIDLSYEKYRELLEYLSYSRLIRIKDNNVVPTSRSKLFIYRTSMIPQTRDVLVIELYSGRKVGVLNEEYVVLNIDEDDILVLAGDAWRVVGYDNNEGKLYVEKINKPDVLAMIPHWEGENIPVSFKVARHVGSIIRRLKNRTSLDNVFFNNVDETVKEYVAGFLRDKGFNFFGDDKTIILDYNEKSGILFINLHGGSKLNRLIKDIIKTRLESLSPSIRFEAYSTPYAILIKPRHEIRFPKMIDVAIETLRNLPRYLSLQYVRKVSVAQKVLLWRIFQVAQRFGAIDPSKTSVSRTILEAFVDTIIGYEAFKEVLKKDYDVEKAHELARKITSGEVILVSRISDEISKFHREILLYSEKPAFSSVTVFDRNIIRDRILSRKITLLCINCGYSFTDRIENLLGRKEYRCPKCGLKTLAPIKSDGTIEKDIVLKWRKGLRLKSSEKKILDDLRKRAILLSQFGELAIIVLGARGVGVSEAIRVINRVMEGSDLYTELYESEKKYVRIKKFLD